MYSKLSGGFFKNRTLTAPFGQRNISLQNLNYVPDEANDEQKRKLRADILKTENSMVVTENAWINLKNIRKGYETDLDNLSKPAQKYQQTLKHAQDMSAMITEGIYTALINGQLTMKDGPSRGYDTELLADFRKILSSYHMTLHTSSIDIQRETADYLLIKFPSQFCKTTLPEDNTKYNEFLIDFNNRLELAYKNAEAKIDNDFATLQKVLLDPLEDGNVTAISRSQPCPAAYKRFEALAEENNISVSKQGSVILVEKNAPEDNHGMGLRS